MPTPKRTPARTRFEPPSPKANVRPATTMATRERPRAMVLVNAVCRTFTAFSQGEAPAWAKAGAARRKALAVVTRMEERRKKQCARRNARFISPHTMNVRSRRSSREILFGAQPLPAALAAKCVGPHFGHTRSTSSGSRQQAGSVCAGKRKNRRRARHRAPLLGNSFPHLPNSRGIWKMCRARTQFFCFSYPGQGDVLRKHSRDRPWPWLVFLGRSPAFARSVAAFSSVV